MVATFAFGAGWAWSELADAGGVGAAAGAGVNDAARARLIALRTAAAWLGS
jgi:hypothetical protein